MTLVIGISLAACALLILGFRLAQRRVSRTAHKRPLQATETCTVTPLRDDQATFTCGHTGAAKFLHNFYGEEYEVNEQVFTKRDLCGECLLRETLVASIRCAVCGFIIMPSDGIALYNDNEHFRQDKTVTGTDDDRSAIACVRMGCCPSLGAFAGHWTHTGFAPAYDGGRTAAEQAVVTGRPVIMSDGPPSSNN